MQNILHILSNFTDNDLCIINTRIAVKLKLYVYYSSISHLISCCNQSFLARRDFGPRDLELLH